jgi:hypothetical protein
MTQRFNAFISAKPRLVSAMLVGIIILPVLANMYNSTFTRMMADDYCFANIAQMKGLWGSLDYWYNNWTGTPSSTIGQSLIALFGPRANALAPSVYLILLWLALGWAFTQLAYLLRLHRPTIIAIFVASLSLYGIVQGIPNVYQALYWTSGSVVYTAPLVLIFFQVGLLLYAIRKHLSGLALVGIMLVCGAMAFIIAGFTQTIAVMETAIFGLALFGCIIAARRRSNMRVALMVVVSSLIGAVLGVIVAIIAPGNVVRQGMHPITQSIPQIVVLSLENTAAFVAMQLALFATVPILVCLCLSAIIANRLQPLASNNPIRFKTALRWMWLSGAVGLILIMAFLAPAAYGMGKMPASRAWVVPQTVLILVVVSWGFAIGLSLKRPAMTSFVSARTVIVIAAILLVGPVLGTINTLAKSGDLRMYAQEWDNRDQSIRIAAANGNTEVTIRPFSVDMATFANLDVVDETATGSYTICMQEYYGLQSVTILEQAGDGT